MKKLGISQCGSDTTTTASVTAWGQPHGQACVLPGHASAIRQDKSWQQRPAFESASYLHCFLFLISSALPSPSCSAGWSMWPVCYNLEVFFYSIHLHFLQDERTHHTSKARAPSLQSWDPTASSCAILTYPSPGTVFHLQIVTVVCDSQVLKL